MSRRRGRSAFFLPEAGYLSRREERLVMQKAREWARLVELGLASPEEARADILGALRAHRLLFGRGK